MSTSLDGTSRRAGTNVLGAQMNAFLMQDTIKGSVMVPDLPAVGCRRLKSFGAQWYQPHTSAVMEEATCRYRDLPRYHCNRVISLCRMTWRFWQLSLLSLLILFKQYQSSVHRAVSLPRSTLAQSCANPRDQCRREVPDRNATLVSSQDCTRNGHRDLLPLHRS